mmetsp:Transcript_55397/g.157029  ORF Transcript_55397/g.157029 Transcript_55397/m.157029 type:complete len:219 (-) Transcript_55397:605-1261(-)
MHGLGNGCSSHLVLRGLLRDGPADLLPAPVVGRIVLAEHGLAQDPGLEAQDLVAVDRQQRSTTNDLRAVRLGLQHAHRCRTGIVFRTHGDLDAALELEHEIRAREGPAVDLRRIIRHLACQQPVETLRGLARRTDERSAGVGDGRAVAVFAERQHFPGHGDTDDLHLPEAQLRFVHRNPLQSRSHPSRVVSAKGDLAGHGVSAREEIAEAVLLEVVQF